MSRNVVPFEGEYENHRKIFNSGTGINIGVLGNTRRSYASAGTVIYLFS